MCLVAVEKYLPSWVLFGGSHHFNVLKGTVGCIVVCVAAGYACAMTYGDRRSGQLCQALVLTIYSQLICKRNIVTSKMLPIQITTHQSSKKKGEKRTKSVLTLYCLFLFLVVFFKSIWFYKTGQLIVKGGEEAKTLKKKMSWEANSEAIQVPSIVINCLRFLKSFCLTIWNYWEFDILETYQNMWLQSLVLWKGPASSGCNLCWECLVGFFLIERFFQPTNYASSPI